jgi:2-polyprenyl-3-methyl-5-hydroxy-6-metoxy-1,4-benzoquinol methylase
MSQTFQPRLGCSTGELRKTPKAGLVKQLPVARKESAGLDRQQQAQISRCRFCGTTLRHVVVDLGASPLANSYLSHDELSHAEPTYPLRVYVCSKCLLVQLEVFADPAQIFSEYAYFASFSDSWLQHARDYVDMAMGRFGLNPDSQVLEIASNDGYLLQYFVERGIPVMGIEPAANVAEVARQKGIETRVEFFTAKAAQSLVVEGMQGDLIVANNVLAHVPELNDFVAGLKLALKPKGVITLEFPHLMRLMAENQFDTIYHEHFSYFSLLAVANVFTSHGLTVCDVDQLPTHGGSLRVYVRHTEDRSKRVEPSVAELQEQERAAGLARLDYYRQFGDRVHQTKRNLIEFLVQAKGGGKSVVGYGAPAKGNTLLNFCGVGPDLIQYTVDRSPYKQNRYLPGSHIPILHPDRINETQPDYVLILPWNLRGEIIEQMAHVRKWGGEFVVPIPEVTVCS